MITIGQMVMRLSRRELANSFHTSERNVAIAVVIVFALAASFGILLAATTGVSTSELDGGGPALAAIMRTLMAGATLTAALVAAITALIVPRSTAMSNLLAVLPVSNRIAVLGMQFPTLGLGLVFALVLSAPFFRGVLGGAQSVSGAAAVAILLVLILATQLLVIAAQRFVVWLAADHLRVPQRYAASLGAVVTIGLSVLTVAHDLVPGRDFLTGATTISGPRDVMPHRVSARLIADPHALDALLMLVLVGMALLMFIVSLRFGGGDGSHDAIHVLHRFSFPQSSFLAHVWHEILVLVRTPQAMFICLALFPALFVLRFLVPALLPSFISEPLAEALIVVPFFLALQSFGRTLPSRWLMRHLSGPSDPSVAAKAIACFVVPGAISLVALAGLLLLRVQLSGDWFSLGGRVLLAYMSMLFVGAIIPYSMEQSVSAAASAMASALVYLIIGTGLNAVLSHIGRLSWTITLVVAVVALAFAALDRMRSFPAEMSVKS